MFFIENPIHNEQTIIFLCSVSLSGRSVSLLSLIYTLNSFSKEEIESELHNRCILTICRFEPLQKNRKTKNSKFLMFWWWILVLTITFLCVQHWLIESKRYADKKWLSFPIAFFIRQKLHFVSFVIRVLCTFGPFVAYGLYVVYALNTSYCAIHLFHYTQPIFLFLNAFSIPFRYIMCVQAICLFVYSVQPVSFTEKFLIWNKKECINDG